jgi:hypothetical protein
MTSDKVSSIYRLDFFRLHQRIKIFGNSYQSNDSKPVDETKFSVIPVDSQFISFRIIFTVR